MGKTQIRGIKTVLNNLERRLNKSKSKRVQKEIAVLTANHIRDTVRKHQNPKTGRKMPKLSQSYREMKMGIVKFRTIDGRVVPFPEPDEILKKVDRQFFNPTATRSNITLKGKMTRALKGEVIGKEIIIDLRDNRAGETITNSEILDFLIAINPDYDFIGIRPKFRKKIKNIILMEIRKNTKPFKK